MILQQEPIGLLRWKMGGFWFNVPPLRAVAYFTHGTLQIYRKDLKIKRDEKGKKNIH